jgi:hypothetical protein
MIEAPASIGKVMLRITAARRVFLQPGFQKTSGYSESARSPRGAAHLIFVPFRQIQQSHGEASDKRALQLKGVCRVHPGLFLSI